MEKQKGLVADIQRCSYHDGPGIRTTVFLKGCNLRCTWCHNPETVLPEPEYLTDPSKCIGCGQCSKGCFSGARTLCGTEMSADEVMDIVMDDAAFYGSEGGLTVSGGEPSVQPEFTCALLSAARTRGISAAVETNMCADAKTISGIMNNADILMADLKIYDNILHKTYTGAGNEKIINNLLLSVKYGIPLILRTPVIAGVNYDYNSLSYIASFASGLTNLIYYELLPYHPLGTAKPKSAYFEPCTFEKINVKDLETLAIRLRSEYHIEIRVAGVNIK
jgi:pyruvate formate lyase activating enzyme